MDAIGDTLEQKHHKKYQLSIIISSLETTKHHNLVWGFRNCIWPFCFYVTLFGMVSENLILQKSLLGDLQPHGIHTYGIFTYI